MSRMLEVLARIQHHAKQGASPRVKLFNPVEESAIHERCQPRCPSAPQELVQLFTTTNGIRFGRFEVCQLLETYWRDDTSFVMHVWGNVDVDCLRGDNNSIEFVGFDPPCQFQVAATISDWLDSLFNEYLAHGEIMSPWECRADGHRSRTYWNQTCPII